MKLYRELNFPQFLMLMGSKSKGKIQEKLYKSAGESKIRQRFMIMFSLIQTVILYLKYYEFTISYKLTKCSDIVHLIFVK
jgi:hypothetical protein